MTDNNSTPWQSPPEIWDKLRPLARQMRHQPTLEESVIWAQLRGRKFRGLRFRRQHAIGPFIVDFYCHEKRLIVEVDGGIHNSTIERDAMRDEYLNALGFTVLHLTNEEVTSNLENALATIGAAIDVQEDYHSSPPPST